MCCVCCVCGLNSCDLFGPGVFRVSFCTCCLFLRRLHARSQLRACNPHIRSQPNKQQNVLFERTSHTSFARLPRRLTITRFLKSLPLCTLRT